IPFLSYFLPGKVDDDNSSYQVFLRFRFDDKAQKADIKQTATMAQTQTKALVQIEELEDIAQITESVDLDQEDEELANELLVN
ncbi:MAG: hypothetical protein H8D23_02735, partial [Candidatus Brocadiales bacterium]|nr:hypothetical protein [Candidatus Brocadiales bacterium]